MTPMPDTNHTASPSTPAPQFRKSLRNPQINYRSGWFFVTSQVTHNEYVLRHADEDLGLLFDRDAYEDAALTALRHFYGNPWDNSDFRTVPDEYKGFEDFVELTGDMLAASPRLVSKRQSFPNAKNRLPVVYDYFSCHREPNDLNNRVEAPHGAAPPARRHRC